MSTVREQRGHELLVIALAVVAILATTALIIKLVDERGSPRSSWVRAGSLSDIQHQRVVFVAEARAYVVASPSSEPFALYARSPHLGERIRYCASSGWFEEQRHGSMFDGHGRYILGPAPRGLDRLNVRIIDGDVWVDTSELFLGIPRGSSDTEPSGPFCRGEL